MQRGPNAIQIWCFAESRHKMPTITSSTESKVVCVTSSLSDVQLNSWKQR